MLTLEQHGFELQVSTYTQTFPSGKYYNTAQSKVDWVCACGTVNLEEPQV